MKFWSNLYIGISFGIVYLNQVINEKWNILNKQINSVSRFIHYSLNNDKMSFVSQKTQDWKWKTNYFQHLQHPMVSMI